MIRLVPYMSPLANLKERDQITYLTGIVSLQQALIEGQREVIAAYRDQSQTVREVHDLAGRLAVAQPATN